MLRYSGKNSRVHLIYETVQESLQANTVSMYVFFVCVFLAGSKLGKVTLYQTTCFYLYKQTKKQANKREIFVDRKSKLDLIERFGFENK